MTEQEELEYKWGSNRPVLKTIMEFFKPTGVLELGVGKYSTKLLYDYNIPLTSIETDEAWINEVGDTLLPRDNFKLIHHPLGIHFKTKYQDIGDKDKEKSVRFYTQYVEPNMEFLFIDHVSGLRAYTLVHMFGKFKYVAYHDAEPKQYKNYNYHSLTPNKIQNYYHILNNTPLVSTGILIHKKSIDDIYSFIDVLNTNNIEYCAKYNIDYTKNFINLRS